MYGKCIFASRSGPFEPEAIRIISATWFVRSRLTFRHRDSQPLARRGGSGKRAAILLNPGKDTATLALPPDC
jgi:hypothetical protein